MEEEKEEDLGLEESPTNDTVENNEKEKLSEEQVLKIVKKDLTDAREAKTKIDEKITGWRNAYDAAPYGNETEGRSKFVSRDSKKTIHWYVPNMLKPFMAAEDMIEAVPVTPEDVQIAKSQSALLNYQFVRSFPRYQFLYQSIFTMAQEGTVVARTGWIHEEEEIDTPFTASAEELQVMMTSGEFNVTEVNEQIVQNPETGEPVLIYEGVAKVSKTSVSKPSAAVIKNENFFIDPTADSVNDGFCIERIDTTLSALRKQDKKYNKNGIYKNVDRVTAAEDNDGTALNNQRRDKLSENGQDEEYESDDKSLKKVTIYEYYGNMDIDGDGIAEPIVCVFSGNTILRLSLNPFPDKEPPFVACPFSKGAFGFWGDSLIDFVEDIQKLKTAILRTAIDTMAHSNNRQKNIQKGSIDALNLRKLREARIGAVIEWNDVNGFKESEGTQISPSLLNMYELFTGEIENESGMTRYSQGLDAKSLNKTASGITAIMNQSQMRIWETSTRFAEEFLKPLFRKWIKYNQKWLDKEIAIRVKGEDYTSVTQDDMGGEYDLLINVALAGNNEQKAQNLVSLIQMAASMPPQVMMMLLVKLTDLWDFQDVSTEIKGLLNGSNDGTGNGAGAGPGGPADQGGYGVEQGGGEPYPQ